VDWIQLIRDGLNFFIQWLEGQVAQFREPQWLLLSLGVALAVVAIVMAVRAKRMFSWWMASKIFKVAAFMIILAFAWPWAEELYNYALEATGNPILSLGAVVLGGFLGYNLVLNLLKRAKR